MLDWLDETQLIYCDTDSVMFLYDPDNPKHKHPTIDCEDALTHGIEFGCGLGQWEDEFKHGEYITEIGIGGAKSYAYRTSKNDIVILFLFYLFF